MNFGVTHAQDVTVLQDILRLDAAIIDESAIGGTEIPHHHMTGARDQNHMSPADAGIADGYMASSASSDRALAIPKHESLALELQRMGPTFCHISNSP